MIKRGKLQSGCQSLVVSDRLHQVTEAFQGYTAPLPTPSQS